MEFDFLSVVDALKGLTLGGVSLAVLVLILTEAIKEFAGLQGKAVRAVALGLGFALTAIAYGMAEGLIPASAAPYIEWVFVAVVGGLGGMGLWHLGKRFLSTNSDESVVLNKLQWREVTELLHDPDVVSVGPLDNGDPDSDAGFTFAEESALMSAARARADLPPGEIDEPSENDPLGGLVYGVFDTPSRTEHLP